MKTREEGRKGKRERKCKKRSNCKFGDCEWEREEMGKGGRQQEKHLDLVENELDAGIGVHERDIGEKVDRRQEGRENT